MTKRAMLKIAVTGSAGSGKSFVCERLRQLGLKIVSSDALAKQAVVPGSSAYKKIVEQFGVKVIAEDGTLNRQVLRNIIVNDDRARKILEKCVHPEIIDLINAFMVDSENESEPAIVVEVPLLFETGMQDRFDVILLVIAERELQIRRMMDRDQVARGDAEALLNAQMPDEQKIEKSDYVINNCGAVEQTKKDVDAFFNTLCKKN